MTNASDKEMLYLLLGALKAKEQDSPWVIEILVMLESYLKVIP